MGTPLLLHVSRDLSPNSPSPTPHVVSRHALIDLVCVQAVNLAKTSLLFSPDLPKAV